MVRITVSIFALGLATLISAQGTQFITGVCTSDADCAAGCCGFNSGKCAGPVVAQERDGGCGFGDAQPNDRAAVALGFTGGVGGGQSAANNGNGNNGAAAGGANNGANNGGGNSGGATNSNPPAGQGANNGANTGASNGAAAGNNGGAAAGGSGNGAQFITGACTSDSDCASGCCGFNSGKCAGPVIAQERDGGCGFGDAQPNDRAAQAFRAGQRRGLQYQWE